MDLVVIFTKSPGRAIDVRARKAILYCFPMRYVFKQGPREKQSPRTILQRRRQSIGDFCSSRYIIRKFIGLAEDVGRRQTEIDGV